MAPDNPLQPTLTAEEAVAFQELGRQTWEAAAAVLSGTLSMDVTCGEIAFTGFPSLGEVPLFETADADSHLLGLVQYTHGFHGVRGVVLPTEQAKVLADLMLGGSGQAKPGPMSDLQLSAVGEALSQMKNGATERLVGLFGMQVEVKGPEVLPFSDMAIIDLMPKLTEEPVQQISFQLQVGDVLTLELMELSAYSEAVEEARLALQVIPELALPSAPPPAPASSGGDGVLGSAGLTEDMLSAAMSQMAEMMGEEPPPRPMRNFQPAAGQPAPMPQQPAAAVAQGYPPPGAIPGGIPGMPPPGGYAGYATPPQPPHGAPPHGDHYVQSNPVTVQPVQFTPFDQQVSVYGEQNKNLDLVMDVTLNLTVELGKTELSIKEVLELTRGSVIELDRIAGEPVDLLANGKLIAKGEVVVIEDSFGLRITSIVSPADRLRGL
jgi:flagellar motor switch protein FliN/FliY